MAIGFTANHSTTQINNDLGDAAVAIRDACLKGIKCYQGNNSLGIEGLLDIGFDKDHAEKIMNASKILNAIADDYYSRFDEDLAEARGGQ